MITAHQIPGSPSRPQAEIVPTASARSRGKKRPLHLEIDLVFRTAIDAKIPGAS